MIKIKEIKNKKDKETICGDILRALPEWFAVKQYILEYIDGSLSLPFYVAYYNGNLTGFVALKKLDSKTAEIYVTGVYKEYHRLGIGRKLMHICTKFCENNKIETLSVKTLDNSANDPYYMKTYKFYEAMGFKPIKVLENYWDENNPCLLMEMDLKK